MLEEDQHIIFTMKQLKAATHNFHETMKIGEGGFGVVYKGVLVDGKVVAVKKLSLKSNQGKKEFINEIRVLKKIRHRNLVKLLGCCIEGGEQILVYEYLKNKCLDNVLFKRKEQLDWQTRDKIIHGIARGLLYLHEDSKARIIHRDIKANNILLDDNLEPKIADFGLAKLSIDNESHMQTTRVAGTYGYMAPEYAMRGQLSTKADVYSFGILLLEIISGRKNSELYSSTDINGLSGWAWRLFTQGGLMEMVDKTLRESNDEQIMWYIHIGLLCSQEDLDSRPPMSKVVLMLSRSSWDMPLPTMPAFFNLDNIDDGSELIASNARDSASSLVPR